MACFVVPEPHKTTRAYHRQAFFFLILRSGNWVEECPGHWKQECPMVEKAGKRTTGSGIPDRKGLLFQKKETCVSFYTFGN